MDPMELLDMERRTGFSHNDIDDFAARMDMISEAMEQIKDGTFDPEKCKIPGFKTPEQEEKERLEKLRLDEERKRKEAERQRKAKEEEKEQWWRRAKLRFAIERGEETDKDAENGSADGDAKAKADQWANRVLAAYKARDANDYSMWNNWVPEDPATLEEKAAREAALEKVRNAEFEKNNPEFCQQFKEDLEKRQQSQRDREREAEKCKLQGNRFYKRRDYTQAIAQYMKSLDQSPFNAAVLTNIAQSYLRLEALDDSVEFSTRALYVNPNHVKALSRRAAVWHRQKKWKEAAQDMEKALQLEPHNEDVVEQHSIVVGDYEDSLKQSKLEEKLSSSKESARSGVAEPVQTTTEAEELRFILELLGKMDEQERALNEKQEKSDDSNEKETKPESVNEAWLGYELLVPFVERNADARDLLRTSGEFHKLTRRLLTLLQALPVLIDKWTSVSNQGSNTTAMMEEMATAAMLHVLAACLTDSPRNQVVLYREAALRQALFDTFNGNSLQKLPASIQEKLLRVFEEAIDAKAWKKDVIASDAAIATLLMITATSIDLNQGSANVEARTKAVVSASSILFTISGDDPHGLAALAKAEAPACLAALSFALQAQRKSSAALSNLLGVLTNLSTHSVLRSSLDAASQDSSLRSRLVRSLLILSSHFTKSSLSPVKRTAYTVCAERGLAALLNFSFQADSLVRKELLKHNVLETVESIIDFITASNVSELMVISSRAVSLLCRLHSLPQLDGGGDEPPLSARLSASAVLDRLYKLCQLSLALISTSASPDLLQTHAQIWCHVGWCISTSEAAHVRGYLTDKAAIPAMVETLALVNGLKQYRRGSAESPTGPERIAGNVVKVLIAMLPLSTADSPVDAKFWTRKRNLKVLVDALQDLPDGLARKNVAIFLAKLCQVYGDAVKPILRELRGLEMLLTVSKSLQATPGSSAKPKAVAF